MSERGSSLRLRAALCASLALPLRAVGPPPPAPGMLLIATPRMRDADFSRAVILVIHADARSTMGLILNRPTEKTLMHLFPELRGTQPGRAPIYLGGLVAQGARGLVRPSVTIPRDTRQVLTVFGGVRVVSDAEALARLAAGGALPDTFRVYAGYVGWSAEQLRAELQAGYWTVAAATEASVFDPQPETLWQRLTARQH